MKIVGVIAVEGGNSGDQNNEDEANKQKVLSLLRIQEAWCESQFGRSPFGKGRGEGLSVGREAKFRRILIRS